MHICVPKYIEIEDDKERKWKDGEIETEIERDRKRWEGEEDRGGAFMFS